MNNRNKRQKHLGRALAAVITFGSLFGVIASPAMAADAERDLDVVVTGFCDPAAAEATTPLWKPASSVTYPTTGNTVDLNDTTAGADTINFSLDNYFESGRTNGECDDSMAVDPDGYIDAEVTGFDASEVTSTVDCDVLAMGSCNAVTFVGSGSINGTLTVSSAATSQTYSGKLMVTWTPDANTTP